jgi:hypothetical protein
VKDLNKPILCCYIFETEIAMPSALSLVPVSRMEEVLITKVEDCEMKVGTLIEELRGAFRNVNSSCRPRKRALCRVLLRKIKEAVPSRRPHCSFLKGHSSAYGRGASITELIHRITEFIRKSVKFC